MGERTPHVQNADLGEVLAVLQQTIDQRAASLPEGSYTTRLLSETEDFPLKKVMEEAGEVALAAKDHDHDHLRYEAADLLYHLLVLLKRWQVTPAELAGELKARFKG
jgi:phosphoribosyl-ATP pyrophosphohydrolase